MSTTLCPLAALFEHNLWANQCMLDVCAKLSDEQLDATALGTYGSIRNTLLHLAGAEERYVILLTGQPRPPAREHEPFPGFEEVRAWLTKNGEALIEIANDPQLTDVLHGTEHNGDSFEVASAVVLTQAINHATEHRAHINIILTHLGVESPDLDAWAYGEAHGQIK